MKEASKSAWFAIVQVIQNSRLSSQIKDVRSEGISCLITMICASPEDALPPDPSYLRCGFDVFSMVLNSEGHALLESLLPKSRKEGKERTSLKQLFQKTYLLECISCGIWDA